MSGIDPHSVFQELVAGYLAGSLDAADTARFEAALREDPGLARELTDYRKIWESGAASAAAPAYDMDAEWEKMKVRLPGYESRGERDSIPLYRTLMRIAAVLLIGLVIGFGAYYALRLSSTTQVLAGNSSVEVELPDGSRVYLNNNSSLRYPKKFEGRNRQVSLKGEAFFEVEADSSRPFVIDAGPALVRVLGTSFNVNAYRANPLLEITVESGVVALSPKAGEERQLVLHAGNGGSYDPRQEELLLLPATDPNKLSWHTRELFFENTSLEEVARVVGRAYHVEIRLDNSALASCPLTASFSRQSLDEILEILELTLDLEISREEGRIILGGEPCTEE